MTLYLQLLAGIILFLGGLQLSSFFSGMELGFYRASMLRLNLDAQSGDKLSQRIMWFMTYPGYFVATTLVGNNIANYIISLSLSLLLSGILTNVSELVDIMTTLVMAPVIFLFGELLPKNLYYLSPLKLVKGNFNIFVWFYRLLLPISFPIITMTRLLQKLSNSSDPETALALSRNRLVQVVEIGEQEGVVGALQNQLVQGLFNKIDNLVRTAIIPMSRVYSVSSLATREEVFRIARQYGLSYIPIHEPKSETQLIGYYDITEIIAMRDPMESLSHPLPRYKATQSKFDVLMGLRHQSAAMGQVFDENHILGIITEQAIVEQLFSKRGATPIIRSMDDI
jgi:CBS domain containing-hemolysin-like protein